MSGIVGVPGQGVMGVVYEAQDTMLGRKLLSHGTAFDDDRSLPPDKNPEVTEACAEMSGHGFASARCRLENRRDGGSAVPSGVEPRVSNETKTKRPR